MEKRSVGKGIREVLALLWSSSDATARRQIVLALAMVALTSILSALAPIPLKLIVDKLSESPASTLPLLTLVALYATSLLAAGVFGELRSLSTGRAERRLYTEISDRLLNHIMYMPFREHLSRKTGAVTEALTTGLQGVQMLLQHSVTTVLPVFIELGMVVFILAGLQQSEFLGIFMAASALYAAIYGFGLVRLIESNTKAINAQGQARAVSTESIINCELVKCYGAEELMQARFKAALLQTQSEWNRFHTIRTITGILSTVVFTGFLAYASYHAAVQVLAGSLSVGSFVLINTYIFQLIQPLQMIGAGLQQLGQAFSNLDKLLEILRQPQEPRQAKEEIALAGHGRLELRNVSFWYDDNQVLHDLNFVVEPGQTVAVVGPSGAGKSTLAKLLMRLFEVAHGEILIDDVSTALIPPQQGRKHIAVVMQDNAVFNESIFYNIAIGKPGATQEEVEAAAKVANLHEFVMRQPMQYQTVVGERGVRLSGGERQRIAIARAAIKRPRMYLFDEATSNLDSRTEQEVMDQLIAISQGCSTLAIAHRLSTIMHADKIIVLDKGKVVETGTHDELLELRGMYWDLWKKQQSDRRRAQVVATA